MAKSDYRFETDSCAIKSCTWVSYEPNNENALDLITQGGYGDFYDYFDEKPVYFRLCHKHAHQFANWINDDNILPRYAHAHNKQEIGYWYGHLGESRTWLAYILTFFFFLYKDRSLKSAKNRISNKWYSHKMWNREDINDKSTPVIKKQWLGEFLFDNRNKF